MPTTAAIYDNFRLFLLLWFLCSSTGVTAGAVLSLLLFHYREPRQREREGRRQAMVYAGVAGLTLGVVIALFLVPPRADGRLLWLLFAVWTAALSAVIAGIYVFKFRLIATTLGLAPRPAARAAAAGLLADLRVPARWLSSLGPAADYAEGRMEQIGDLAARAGRRLAAGTKPRPRMPAGDALPPEREPLPEQAEPAPPEPPAKPAEPPPPAPPPHPKPRLRSKLRPR